MATGMLPFVIAPRAGKLRDVVVDRSFLTAASIEFDAVLVLESPAPAPDAIPSFDAKGGHSTSGKPIDPRVVKMVAEMFRHCKAIAVTPDSTDTLVAADVPAEAPGVVVAKPAKAVEQLEALLSMHRIWERFPAVAAH